MRKMASGMIALWLSAGLMACNTTPVRDGAVLGGALGAATGAIIGHQSGKQGEGALIGAGVGALTGALVGDQVDERGMGRYPAASASSASTTSSYAEEGHYETRIVRSPNGEQYEERVWVRHQ